MANVIYYKGKVGLEDVEFGRGTFLRGNSIGGIEELNQIKPTDVVDWCVDVRDYDDIVTAINAIGSTYTSLLINDSLQDIDSSITVPDNITLIITAGNKLTISANTTLNCQIILHIGANIYTGTGITSTIKSSKNIITTPYHQIFTGSGKVKFSQFSEVYPEWFGAEADGSTNDYSAFTNSLISGCTLNGGVRILINQQKMYVINNGASAGITLDPDNLPDSTITATSNEELPVFEIEGYGTPGRFNPSGNNPSGGLKFTGSGDGIEISGSTRSWRGHIKLEDFNILGGTASSRVANDGISITTGSLKNIFRKLNIAYFSGDGFVMSEFTANDNIIEDVSSFYNDGLGFNLTCNEQLFLRCKAMRNASGGVDFEQCTDVQWLRGAIAHNYVPQIIIGAVERISIDTYMEGQFNSNVPYTPLDGTGVGMVRIDGTINSCDVKLRALHAGTTDVHNEQYIVYFNGDPTVRGLALDVMAPSGFDDANGDQMAIVGPIASSTLSLCSYKAQRQGSVSDFADTATENAFQLIQESENDYVRLKTILPFAVTFHITDIANDFAAPAAQDMYLNAGANTPDIELKLPWDCALIGVAINSNLTQGTIQLTDSNSSLDESMVFGDSGDNEQYRYDLETHTVDDGIVFAPKITCTADLGGATRDANITFFFAILNHDQDRDS